LKQLLVCSRCKYLYGQIKYLCIQINGVARRLLIKSKLKELLLGPPSIELAAAERGGNKDLPNMADVEDVVNVGDVADKKDVVDIEDMATVEEMVSREDVVSEILSSSGSMSWLEQPSLSLSSAPKSFGNAIEYKAVSILSQM
jgi:hypothetical protein